MTGVSNKLVEFKKKILNKRNKKKKVPLNLRSAAEVGKY